MPRSPTARPPGTADRAPGRTAAYWAGLTYTTVSEGPEDTAPGTTSAKASATTPGSAETCCCSAGRKPSLWPTWRMASAPTCCQDAATWASVTDVPIMSGNATMASISTTANDGKTEPGGVRVARATGLQS